jgi:CHAT domain-containing protein/tetratricopeptide (TPR) repeat protein
MFHFVKCLTLLPGAIVFLATAEDASTAIAEGVEVVEDFKSDSRTRFQANEAVHWEGRGVRLETGGRMVRGAALGPQATIAIEWTPTPLMTDGEASELQVGVAGTDGVVSIAAIVQARSGEATTCEAVVAVISTNEQNERSLRVVRRFPLPRLKSVGGRWEVRYRFGVIELYQGDKRLSVGDAGRGDVPISGVYVAQEAGAGTLHSLKILGQEPPPQLSQEKALARQAALEKFGAAQQRVFEELGRSEFEAALEDAEQAEAFAAGAFGADSTFSLDAASATAMCLERLDRKDDALRVYRRVYDELRQRKGADHPATARALRSVGECLQAMDRSAEACKALEESAAAMEDVLGTADKETAFTLLSLGRVQRAMGEVGPAQRSLEKSLHSYEETYGADSDRLLLVLQFLASLHESVGDAETAGEYLDRALKIAVRSFGEDAEESKRLRDWLDRVTAVDSAGGPSSKLAAAPTEPTNPTAAHSEAGAASGRTVKRDRDEDASRAGFEGDPRSGYLISGPVEWIDGRLEFGGGGRASSTCECLSVEETLVIDESTAGEGAGCETRLGFLAGAGALELVLDYRPADSGSRSEVRVEFTERGKPSGTVLRTFAAPSSPDGRWTFRYNHGMAEIQKADADVGAAWSLPLTATPLRGCYILQSRGRISLQDWRTTAAPLKEDSSAVARLSEQDLDRLQTLNVEAAQRLTPGELPVSLRLATEGYELARQSLGENHHLALAFRGKMAAVLERMGRAQETVAVRRSIASAQERNFGDAHPEYAFALRDLASAYSLSGRQTEAIKPLEDCLAILARTLGPSDPEVLSTELQLGNDLATTDRWTESFARLESCLRGRQQRFGSSALELCLPYEALATAHQAAGHYRLAAECRQSALQIRCSTQGELHPDALAAKRGLVEVLDRLGRYDEARRLLEESIVRLEELPQPPATELADMQFALAELLRSHGDYDYATVHMEASLQAMDGESPSGDFQALLRRGAALDRLAQARLDRRDFVGAADLFQRALDLFDAGLGPDHQLSQQTRFMLAVVAIEERRDDEARTLLLELLDSQERCVGRTHSSLVNTLRTLAGCEQRRGDGGAALKLLERALQVSLETLGEECEATAFVERELAAEFARIGDPAKSQALLRRSRRTLKGLFGEDHALYAEALAYQAGVEVTLGDWKSAERDYRGALDVQLRRLPAEIAGLPEAQAIRHVAALMNARAPYLRICSATLNSSRAALSRRLKSAADVSLEDVYQRAWLSKAIVTRAARGCAAGTSAALEELRSVSNQLADLSSTASFLRPLTPLQRDRLLKLTDRKERLQRQLALEAGAIAHGAEPSFSELARRLPPDVAFVDFFRVPDSRPVDVFSDDASEAEYYAFVLRSQVLEPGYHVALVMLGGARPIDRQIAAWRADVARSAAARDEVADVAAARTLRDLVWTKLEPQLSGCKTVVIAPDGALAFVPWCALPGAKPGAYLAEELAVATAIHGPQVLSCLDRPTADDGRLLLVGDVDFGARSKSATRFWGSLPGSKQEIEAIADLWPKSSTITMLTRGQATKERFRRELANSAYVHIASHGYFADPKYQSYFALSDEYVRDSSTRGPVDDPRLRSPLSLTGVVLAGANQAVASLDALPADSGILSGEELANARLSRTEMVVLSACDSGLGAVGGGEGAFSLQRAFQLAGARTVVASLWKVDDSAAGPLMKEFYEELRKGKRSRLDALRAAQLTILRRYDPVSRSLRPVATTKSVSDAARTAPYYWASFTLSGDWR